MTALQELVATLANDAGIAPEFMEASYHAYHCKCAICLQWWVRVGPEDTGSGWSFGPFSRGEYVAAGGVVPDYPPIDEPEDDKDDTVAEESAADTNEVIG